MSTITIPRRPAVSNYPDEKAFADELARAQQFYEAELTSSDGWEFAGERDGVRLDKKMDPSDAYAVPTVRGTCIVENATTEQVLSVIQQPGMRLIWDPRFESGAMLKRYTRTSYQFYSVMKGLGWLIWPRSIVGSQSDASPPLAILSSHSPTQHPFQRTQSRDQCDPNERGRSRVCERVRQSASEGDSGGLAYQVCLTSLCRRFFNASRYTDQSTTTSSCPTSSRSPSKALSPLRSFKLSPSKSLPAPAGCETPSTLVRSPYLSTKNTA